MGAYHDCSALLESSLRGVFVVRLSFVEVGHGKFRGFLEIFSVKEDVTEISGFQRPADRGGGASLTGSWWTERAPQRCIRL